MPYVLSVALMSYVQALVYVYNVVWSPLYWRLPISVWHYVQVLLLILLGTPRYLLSLLLVP